MDPNWNTSMMKPVGVEDDDAAMEVDEDQQVQQPAPQLAPQPLRQQPQRTGSAFGTLNVNKYVELLTGLFPCEGGAVNQTQLNVFSGDLGKMYLKFINDNTIWVNEFTRYWLPSYDAFSWLSPYPGNAHNRALFTQLALLFTLKAKHEHNGVQAPNLFEPFIGTGQIFMGAEAFADQFLEATPFNVLGAGDLNEFLIAAYRAMQAYPDFAERYFEYAYTQDELLDQGFDGGIQPHVYNAILNEINGYDRTNNANDLDIGMRYIWLVNRCLRQTSVKGGRLKGKVNVEINVFGVQTREKRTLPNVVRLVRTANRHFIVADFANTAAHAQGTDVVFFDCPFPEFSRMMPSEDGGLLSTPSNTYGLDGDKALQSRIIEVAQGLATAGTTVLLCNFANPDLVLAYHELLSSTGVQHPRDYIFTYKSPSSDTTVYQLAIVPGVGVDMSALAMLLRRSIELVTGKSNFMS
jgi:site-specific DNA-adenine methylase